MSREKVKLGSCGVDSGQLIIVDPCYVDMGFDYDAVCSAHTVGCSHDKDGPWNENFIYHHGYGGPVHGGVVTSTGWGDGVYPVYAEVEYGRVMKIVIEFEEEESPF